MRELSLVFPTFQAYNNFPYKYGDRFRQIFKILLEVFQEAGLVLVLDESYPLKVTKNDEKGFSYHEVIRFDYASYFNPNFYGSKLDGIFSEVVCVQKGDYANQEIFVLESSEEMKVRKGLAVVGEEGLWEVDWLEKDE